MSLSVASQEISRRELRKALERQGVTMLREEEVLVLCDSLDPERRGRVHLSDVRESLARGAGFAGVGSECEVNFLSKRKYRNERRPSNSNNNSGFAAGRRYKTTWVVYVL